MRPEMRPGTLYLTLEPNNSNTVLVLALDSKKKVDLFFQNVLITLAKDEMDGNINHTQVLKEIKNISKTHKLVVKKGGVIEVKEETFRDYADICHKIGK